MLRLHHMGTSTSMGADVIVGLPSKASRAQKGIHIIGNRWCFYINIMLICRG